MNPVVQIILLTALAGLAMPAGALLATVEHLHPRWLENELRHSVIAFGGGILLSAVALVLVPDGAKELSLRWVIAWFVIGGIAFWALDILLAASRSPASQLAAMLADFLPESLALGAAFATGEPTGMLLALLITLQNLPEGFNACREMLDRGHWTAKRIVIGVACLAPLGPIAGLSGYYGLGQHPQAVAALMLVAAAGILYLTFEDIAPQAKLANRQAPPLGAVLGFLCGLIGQLLTTHG